MASKKISLTKPKYQQIAVDVAEKIAEGKLPTDELVKMQFQAIKILIDDCEKLVIEK